MHLLHNLLLKSSSTLAVAESFTSGLLSSKISSVSGSSNYFKGGLVVYQNSVKSDILSVPMNIIMEKTEVSHEVAKEMAINTLNKFNSDYSISTTGYAGPNGGNKNSPIGTFFIAVACCRESVSKRFFFKGNRSEITNYAVEKAILFLFDYIKNKK